MTTTAEASAEELRAKLAADDARIAAALDAVTARTAHVLDTPGLPAPVAQLATALADLVVLLRAEIVDDEEA